MPAPDNTGLTVATWAAAIEAVAIIVLVWLQLHYGGRRERRWLADVGDLLDKGSVESDASWRSGPRVIGNFRGWLASAGPTPRVTLWNRHATAPTLGFQVRRRGARRNWMLAAVAALQAARRRLYEWQPGLGGYEAELPDPLQPMFFDRRLRTQLVIPGGAGLEISTALPAEVQALLDHAPVRAAVLRVFEAGEASDLRVDGSGPGLRIEVSWRSGHPSRADTEVALGAMEWLGRALQA